MEITPVLITFCGDYLCVHYFYVPWLIMTSQWVTTFLGMPHCGITMGNDIARDIHYDITMGNLTLLCVNIMASQWIMTLLWNSFAMNYYTKLWYSCFHRKRFKIVPITITINIQSIVVWHKNKNKFVVIICGQHVHMISTEWSLTHLFLL